MIKQKKVLRLFLLLLFISFILYSCAASKAYRKGREASFAEDWDKAVAYYSEAVKNDPDNPRYRMELDIAKRNASYQHLRKAKVAMNEGDYRLALVEFRLAVDLDPTNQLALLELEKARNLIQEKAKKREKRLKIEEEKPKFALKPEAEGKLTLHFPRGMVKEIYRAISKLSGINILFDSSVRDFQTSFSVKGVTFVEALDSFTQANGFFYKILNPNTIVVVPNTPVKRQAYLEQGIRAFYLENADPKAMMNHLRTLLNIRNISLDDKINAVVVRGSLDELTLAERVIERLDKPRGEVIVDLEILEVNRNKLNEFGILFSNYQIIQALNQTEQGISITDLKNITPSDWFLTIPNVAYSFLKQDTNAKLIAKPQLRIMEGEKSKLFIGESIPVKQTVFNPAQTVGGNVVPISSYTYRDVGITIEVAPRLNSEDEITLELSIKIDSVLGQIGVELPTFTSRTFDTIIRLHDGETNLLAGLIRSYERKGLTGIPGISDIPILGMLFSQNRFEKEETDIVLTLTPHIISYPEITPEDLSEIWAGTAQLPAYRLTPPSERLEPSPVSTPAKGEREKLEERVKTTLGISPGFITPAKGEHFSVEVVISDAENVARAVFQLVFDQRFIQVADVSLGGFMGKDGAEVSFVRNFDNQAGMISINLSRLSAEEGVSGGGTLVRIEFIAKERGFAPIGFSGVRLISPDGDEIPAKFSAGSIQVS
jgi:general secretion pathway protein D